MAERDLGLMPYILIFKAQADGQVVVWTRDHRIIKSLKKGEYFIYRGLVRKYANDAAVSVLEVPLDRAESDIEDVRVHVPVEALADYLGSIDAKLDVNLSTVASEFTLQSVDARLSSIDGRLSQPNNIYSATVTIDNSAGTGDLVQALFASATPSRSAVIKRVSSGTGDGTVIYLGGGASQDMDFAVGDVLKTEIDDLSKVYVRVPAGVTAVLKVLWEVYFFVQSA